MWTESLLKELKAREQEEEWEGVGGGHVLGGRGGGGDRPSIAVYVSSSYDKRSGCNSLQQPFDLLQTAGGVRQAHATARVTHLHAEEACPPHDLMRPPPSPPQGEVVTVPAEVYRLYMAAESEKVQLAEVTTICLRILLCLFPHADTAESNTQKKKKVQLRRERDAYWHQLQVHTHASYACFLFFV